MGALIIENKLEVFRGLQKGHTLCTISISANWIIYYPWVPMEQKLLWYAVYNMFFNYVYG